MSFVRNIPLIYTDRDGMKAKAALKTGWNYTKYAGGSIIDGGVRGDFIQDPNGWNTVGQIGSSFIPFYGQGADVRDMGAGWKNCNGGWGCAGALSLGVVGFVPGIGDGVKLAKKSDIIVDINQLSKKFKHSTDFGLDSTKRNSENLEKFKSAIEEHISSSKTEAIQGTFRGIDVTHYFNQSTGNNVIVNSNGAFVSGWKLNSKQIENLLGRGSLGGF